MSFIVMAWWNCSSIRPISYVSAFTLESRGLGIRARIAAGRERNDHDPEQYTGDQEPPHGVSLLQASPAMCGAGMLPSQLRIRLEADGRREPLLRAYRGSTASRCVLTVTLRRNTSAPDPANVPTRIGFSSHPAKPAASSQSVASLQRHDAQRDHRDPSRPLVLTETPRGLRAVHVRQAEIHQDDVGHVLDRERDRLGARRRLDASRNPAARRTHPGELPVPVVVVDDQGDGHRRILRPWRSGSSSRRIT